MPNWLPERDAELGPFFLNFATLVAAGPAAYGLSAADATALTTMYAAWDAAFRAAINPTTRTRGTVATKDAQRTAALTLLRRCGAAVRVNPAVSDALKIGLGLRIAASNTTAVPRPSTKPALAITRMLQGVHELRATDETTPSRRARPRGSTGLMVYRAVSDAPVNDPARATFLGLVGKPTLASTFTPADRGKIATYFARWANARGEAGPWSQGVSGSVAA